MNGKKALFDRNEILLALNRIGVKYRRVSSEEVINSTKIN